MTIAIETATVYRAGGRRFFTKRAAERAHVRALMTERCQCVGIEHDDRGHVIYPGNGCRFHDGSDYAATVTARYISMFFRATPSAPVAG